jgi:hypothetical protein
VGEPDADELAGWGSNCGSDSGDAVRDGRSTGRRGNAKSQSVERES